VLPGDMVMRSDFRAAKAGEEAFRLIGAGVAIGIGNLVVDPLYREVSGELIPM